MAPESRPAQWAHEWAPCVSVHSAILITPTCSCRGSPLSSALLSLPTKASSYRLTRVCRKMKKVAFQAGGNPSFLSKSIETQLKQAQGQFSGGSGNLAAWSSGTEDTLNQSKVNWSAEPKHPSYSLLFVFWDWLGWCNLPRNLCASCNIKHYISTAQKGTIRLLLTWFQEPVKKD